jgi:hypothetical protein
MKTLVLITTLVWGSVQDLPEVNQKIVTYCKAQEGKKIDRGECWDLAKAALDQAGAVWESPYTFGTLYDYKKETILPGDVIQFENVEFKGELYKVSMPHHTAIVIEVLSPLLVKVAHQNFAGKRTVQFTELNFNDLKKGKVEFFRPKK